jgi:hypothetical protein
MHSPSNLGHKNMTTTIKSLALGFIFSLVAIASANAQSLKLNLTPAKASAFADIAVLVIKQTTGKRLDYSPASLKLVDEYVLGHKKNGATTASMNKTLIALGCYVGEVMVRNLGFKWDNPTDKELALGFDATGIRGKNGGFSNPIGKVFKLMQNGEEDSVAIFYAVFSKDLSKEIKAMVTNR